MEASLRRDSERGAAVFDDYAVFHENADQDAVCRRLRADIAAILKHIQALTAPAR